jgi:hypothetical protein
VSCKLISAGIFLVCPPEDVDGVQEGVGEKLETG